MKIELTLDMDTLTDLWTAGNLALGSLKDKAEALSDQQNEAGLKPVQAAIKDLNTALSALSCEVGRAILKGRVQYEDPDRG